MISIHTKKLLALKKYLSLLFTSIVLLTGCKNSFESKFENKKVTVNSLVRQINSAKTNEHEIKLLWELHNKLKFKNWEIFMFYNNKEVNIFDYMDNSKDSKKVLFLIKFNNVDYKIHLKDKKNIKILMYE